MGFAAENKSIDELPRGNRKNAALENKDLAWLVRGSNISLIHDCISNYRTPEARDLLILGSHGDWPCLHIPFDGSVSVDGVKQLTGALKGAFEGAGITIEHQQIDWDQRHILLTVDRVQDVPYHYHRSDKGPQTELIYQTVEEICAAAKNLASGVEVKH